MPGTTDEPTAQDKLDALLQDLNELSDYLSERGRHTYELAQRFLENAQRNPGTRSYDERQATMLGYQRHVWIEIAGLVNKLLITYGAETDPWPDSEKKVDADQTRSENS